MLNFLNLKSFSIHLFFVVASSLSTLWVVVVWLARTYVIRHGEKFKAREFLPLLKEIPKTLGLLVDHPYITSAKDWVGVEN